VYRTYFNKLDDLLRFIDPAEYARPLAKAYAREEDGGDLLLLAAMVRQDMGKVRVKWGVGKREVKRVGVGKIVSLRYGLLVRGGGGRMGRAMRKERRVDAT